MSLSCVTATNEVLPYLGLPVQLSIDIHTVRAEC